MYCINTGHNYIRLMLIDFSSHDIKMLSFEFRKIKVSQAMHVNVYI